MTDGMPAGRPAAAPPGGVPKSVTSSGWKKVGGGTVKGGEQRFKLSTDGKSYRYYLVWITKLPPEQSSVQIAEIRLFRLGTT